MAQKTIWVATDKEIGLGDLDYLTIADVVKLLNEFEKQYPGARFNRQPGRYADSAEYLSVEFPHKETVDEMRIRETREVEEKEQALVRKRAQLERLKKELGE
jgi:hypothetical protein